MNISKAAFTGNQQSGSVKSQLALDHL
jgi:hypothetical protein